MVDATPSPSAPRVHSAVPSSTAARASRDVAVKPESNDKSSLVFLRLKRKRTDDPMECLVVHSEPDTKRIHRADGVDRADAGSSNANGLLQAFTKLSTTEKRFVFKHIDTMEELAPGRTKWTERLKRKARSLKDERAEILAKKKIATVFKKDPTGSKQTEARVQQQQTRSRARRKEEVQRSRGLQPIVEIKEKQTMELHGIRLVDLQVAIAPSGDSSTTSTVETLEKDSSETMTVNGARLRPTRVLNPHERELDEAIWTAFRDNDFAQFFQIVNAQRPELRVNPMRFQRPADGGTALMAAALHGRSDVIEVMLRSGTTSVLQQDWEGDIASAFARRGGHVNVETALLACEEAEHEKDYVYDVYCVDISASDGQESLGDGTTSSEDGSELANVTGMPVVTVSSEVQRWLSEEPCDEVEEYMLESDVDSDEEADGMSEDSNDEDHAANDYPDEESSDESLADSEDLDEIGARHKWRDTEDDYTERDDFD